MRIIEQTEYLNNSNDSSIIEELFEDALNMIQEKFKCDIDDIWYDVDDDKNELKAQMVLYNVSYEDEAVIKKIIHQHLPQYDNVQVDVYENSDYEIGPVKKAYVVRVWAYNDNFNF